MSKPRTLETVRREIDAIDHAIHDLIVRRTTLVEEVRSIKRDWAVKIQPAREAEIAYRLIKRHRGPFPKRELIAIWRHLINATLSFEGPFSVAVFAPHGDRVVWDLARDHFGQYTPIQREQSADDVIRRIATHDATVGVLPVPAIEDATPWWRHLLGDAPIKPRVIARLPFVSGSNAEFEGHNAMALSPVAFVPTGRDRSCLVAEMSVAPPPPSQFANELGTAGLSTALVTAWYHEPEAQTWMCYIELEGFVMADDPALIGTINSLYGSSVRFHHVGGYATPLASAELEPDSRMRRQSQIAPDDEQRKSVP